MHIPNFDFILHISQLVVQFITFRQGAHFHSNIFWLRVVLCRCRVISAIIRKSFKPWFEVMQLWLLVKRLPSMQCNTIWRKFVFSNSTWYFKRSYWHLITCFSQKDGKMPVECLFDDWFFTTVSFAWLDMYNFVGIDSLMSHRDDFANLRDSQCRCSLKKKSYASLCTNTYLYGSKLVLFICNFEQFAKGRQMSLIQFLL